MLVGIVEFLGWFGAVTVLAGYLLFSLGRIPNGPLYQLLNLVGGLSVAINVAAHHAIPSTIVNGVWAVIALVVLVRTARARRSAGRSEVEAPAATLLHTEPPATTAVLPIVGPALRDHESEPEGADLAAPRLRTDTDADRTEPSLQAGPQPHLRTEPHLQGGSAVAPAAPMTESVPVITATIALALVAAAQHHADQGTAPEREPRNEQPERHEQPEQHGWDEQPEPHDGNSEQERPSEPAVLQPQPTR